MFGSHDLALETGRYKKQPAEGRLFLKCSQIEEELQVVIKCKMVNRLQILRCLRKDFVELGHATSYMKSSFTDF